MEDQRTGKLKDSTLLRIEKGVGFNARIEPVWHTFFKLQPRMGFLERWREKRRLRRMLRSIDRKLAPAGIPATRWERQEGGCVCNLRVAKLGLIGEFKRSLQGAIEAVPAREWPHLAALRDNACMMLPLDFGAPLLLESGRDDVLPVASSVRIRAELASINDRLRIEETFAIKKMVDYLDATERDISIYESRFGTAESFWPKFVYILIKKLADVSIEKKLPAIFA